MCRLQILKVTFRYDGAVIIERPPTLDPTGAGADEENVMLHKPVSECRRELIKSIAGGLGFTVDPADDDSIVRSNE